MISKRELNEIRKHYHKYHREAGESVVWYEFTPFASAASAGSVYDDVYDEAPRGTGGRKYGPGVTVPVLMISEQEDLKRAIADGRQPVQIVEFRASIDDFRKAGITAPWEYKNHLNDVFMYDGRYFSVYHYRVRGRLRDDVMVLVEGMEIYVPQEMVNDEGFGGFSVPNEAWPAGLPYLG